MEEENIWKPPDTAVEEGRQFKQNVIYTLFYLFEGLIVTELTAISICKVPVLVQIMKAHLLLTALVAIVLIMMNSVVLRQANDNQNRLVMWVSWILHSVVVGIPQIVLNVETFPMAVLYTSLLVLILVLKSCLISEAVIEFFMPKLDVLQLTVLLMSGYYIAFPDLTDTLSSMIRTITLHGGFVIFSGLLVCDACCLAKLADKKRFDPMVFSLLLHTDIVNLFFRSSVFISMDSEYPMHGFL